MRKSKYELLIFWVQVWGDGIHPIFQKLNQIKWLSNELNSQFYWFTQWNYAIHSSHIIQVIQLKTGYSCTLMSWFCCSENSVLSDGKPFSSSIFLKIVHDCVFSWKLQALVHQAWKACRHRIIGEVMDLIFTCCVCWLALVLFSANSWVILLELPLHINFLYVLSNQIYCKGKKSDGIWNKQLRKYYRNSRLELFFNPFSTVMM